MQHKVVLFVAATRAKYVHLIAGMVKFYGKRNFLSEDTAHLYMVNGKQYVVIPATGSGKLGTPAGDAYVAFSLPGL